MNPVVHFEVPADDRGRATAFYTDVFGWQVDEMPLDGDVYTSVMTTPVDEEYNHERSGAINGAVIDRDDTLETPIITVDVDSIDDQAEAIEAAGGTMLVEKGEVPEMGYYAYFEDPEGNVLGLWESMA